MVSPLVLEEEQVVDNSCCWKFLVDTSMKQVLEEVERN